MTDINKSHITLVVDRSGSMASIKRGAEGISLGVRNNVAFTVTNTSMAGAYDSVTRSLAGYRTTGAATYATSVDADGNES